MKVAYKGTELTEKEKKEIWEILCQCDREFVPPLSARNSSSQKKLDLGLEEDALKGEVPTTYFSEMIRQNFVLAYEDTEESANCGLSNEDMEESANCGLSNGDMMSGESLNSKAADAVSGESLNNPGDEGNDAAKTICGRVIGFMTFKDHYMCDALAEFGESLYITTVCVREELRGRGTLDAMYRCMETEAVQAWDCGRISTRTWSTNAAHLHELGRRGYQLLAVLKDDRGAGVDTVYYGMRG